MKSVNIDYDIKAGDVIIVAGYIGLKGTEIMANLGREALLTRYNEDFVDRALRLYEYAPDEEYINDTVSGLYLKAVHDGGVFKALWDISVEQKVGFDVNIFNIPVRQETIELANFYDINPYEMVSEKCVVAIAKGGVGLVRNLNEAGIKAAVIGEIIAGNDKIIRHQDGALFLRPAKQDSIKGFLSRTEK